MASRSWRRVISSTAMTCGFMARSTMGMPMALGQPSSTSVRLPTSICGTPPHMTATSPRSSSNATRRTGHPSPSEMQRTRSRSSVVFPPPGGESSSVLKNRPPRNKDGANVRPMPVFSRPIRSTAEESCRMPVFSSPLMTAVPHSPSRKPPRTDKYPWRMVSAAA